MMSTINHVTWYIMFWLISNPLKRNHVLSIVPTSPPQAVSKKFFTSAWETCIHKWTFYWEKIKIDWESSKSTTITAYACIMHMTTITMMGIIQNRDAVKKVSAGMWNLILPNKQRGIPSYQYLYNRLSWHTFPVHPLTAVNFQSSKHQYSKQLHRVLKLTQLEWARKLMIHTLGRNVGFTGRMAVFEGKTLTG